MRTSRRGFAVAGVACLVATVAAGIALAATTWPTVTFTPTVSPSTAGTPAQPQGVKLTAVWHWQKLSYDPVTTRFYLWFPPGWQYNGGNVKRCSRTQISLGPGNCPKGSIMGSGTETLYWGTVEGHPNVTIVNGGAKTVYLYLAQNAPARVREAEIGKIRQLAGGEYAYELSVTVPQNLQAYAGTPIELTYLKFTAGEKKWLATTACPGGDWTFKTTTDYENGYNNKRGSASSSTSLKCTT